jgi:hypothetical protein
MPTNKRSSPRGLQHVPTAGRRCVIGVGDHRQHHGDDTWREGADGHHDAGRRRQPVDWAQPPGVPAEQRSGEESQRLQDDHKVSVGCIEGCDSGRAGGFVRQREDHFRSYEQDDEAACEGCRDTIRGAGRLVDGVRCGGQDLSSSSSSYWASLGAATSASPATHGVRSARRQGTGGLVAGNHQSSFLGGVVKRGLAPRLSGCLLRVLAAPGGLADHATDRAWPMLGWQNCAQNQCTRPSVWLVLPTAGRRPIWMFLSTASRRSATV